MTLHLCVLSFLLFLLFWSSTASGHKHASTWQYLANERADWTYLTCILLVWSDRPQYSIQFSNDRLTKDGRIYILWANHSFSSFYREIYAMHRENKGSKMIDGCILHAVHDVLTRKPSPPDEKSHKIIHFRPYQTCTKMTEDANWICKRLAWNQLIIWCTLQIYIELAWFYSIGSWIKELKGCIDHWWLCKWGI